MTETDIADIISKWSGIPVTKLVASERSKLLGLTDELHKRVIGQDEAVEAVADAIQRQAPDLTHCWRIESCCQSQNNVLPPKPDITRIYGIASGGR